MVELLALVAYKNLVDLWEKTWNTFFDYMFKWLPVLRQIYEEVDIRVNRSG